MNNQLHLYTQIHTSVTRLVSTAKHSTTVNNSIGDTADPISSHLAGKLVINPGPRLLFLTEMSDSGYVCGEIFREGSIFHGGNIWGNCVWDIQGKFSSGGLFLGGEFFMRECVGELSRSPCKITSVHLWFAPRSLQGSYYFAEFIFPDFSWQNE